MKISKTLEMPDGIVVFEGELSQVEADAVIKLGLMSLILGGQIVPTEAQEDGDGFTVDGNETIN